LAGFAGQGLHAPQKKSATGAVLRPPCATVYGLPYMALLEDERFEVTLRGLSPRELEVRAEGECAKHFGETGWRFCERTCAPCLVTLGGRVRLYEGHYVAEAQHSVQAIPGR
jgi:hypothetical protein